MEEFIHGCQIKQNIKKTKKQIDVIAKIRTTKNKTNKLVICES